MNFKIFEGIAVKNRKFHVYFMHFSAPVRKVSMPLLWKAYNLPCIISTYVSLYGI